MDTFPGALPVESSVPQAVRAMLPSAAARTIFVKRVAFLMRESCERTVPAHMSTRTHRTL